MTILRPGECRHSETLLCRIRAGAQLWGQRDFGKTIWDGAAEVMVAEISNWLVQSFKHNDEHGTNGDTVSAQITSTQLGGSVTVASPGNWYGIIYRKTHRRSQGPVPSSLLTTVYID